MLSVRDLAVLHPILQKKGEALYIHPPKKKK